MKIPNANLIDKLIILLIIFDCNALILAILRHYSSFIKGDIFLKILYNKPCKILQFIHTKLLKEFF